MRTEICTNVAQLTDFVSNHLGKVAFYNFFKNTEHGHR